VSRLAWAGKCDSLTVGPRRPEAQPKDALDPSPGISTTERRDFPQRKGPPTRDGGESGQFGVGEGLLPLWIAEPDVDLAP
jgi:hypothetical protein